MYGAEEWNLSLRMLEKDYLTLVDPSVILWHKEPDSSRDRTHELILRQCNALANRVTLWPLELALIYGLRTLLKHPYRAARRGLLWSWLQKWPAAWIGTVARGLRTRRPLSRETVRIYNKLKSMHVNSADEAFAPNFGYAKCIASELFQAH